MTTPPDSPIDDPPAGFNELLKEIEQSFIDNTDALLQERVFKNAFNFVRGRPHDHWFCEKYMFPVVSHLMIVFSFPASEISKLIRRKIEENCENCSLCLIQYHKGKLALRNQFALSNQTTLKQIDEFTKIIDTFEAETAENNLKPLLDGSIDLNLITSNTLPSNVQYGLMSCILNPNILRLSFKLKQDLQKVFTTLPLSAIPKANLLVPGIAYFLFEGNSEQKQWAKLTCKNISETPEVEREQATIPLFTEEFKIWHYKIQDATFFSIPNCIKFWDIFILVEPFIDNSTFIGVFNLPKDLELQSIEMNLRLYPLIRVYFNHLMSKIKEILPILLRVLNIYLTRLGDEFWNYTIPFTFINVLDRILNDTNFASYLNRFLPKSSGSNGSLIDLIDWMKKFTSSLTGSQKQTAGVRLAVYLFQVKVSNLESESIILNLGCQLLCDILKNESDDLSIGLKSFSIDLLKKRDCRAAIDNYSKIIIKQISLKSNNEQAMKLIQNAIYFDVVSLANHSVVIQECLIPTSFDIFPLLWTELMNLAGLHTNIPLVKEIIISFKSVSSIIKFEAKKSNGNADKKFLAAAVQHSSNVETILSFIRKFFEKIALLDPLVLRSQIFNDQSERGKAVAIGYWSCVLQPQVNQSAIDILYQIFDDDDIENGGTGAGRLESIQALFKLSLLTSLFAINENLLVLCNMKAFEPCPKAVRILMDVIEALTDPLNGLLISKRIDLESQAHLKTFWERGWLFLVMIYQGALTWANQYKIEHLIEFTRDTLDLSRKHLDSFLLVLDVTNSKEKDEVSALFRIFMHAFHYVIVWLRLGDVSLLNSCVDLVFKGFDLAKDLDISIDEDFLINFTKYGAKAKKFNNKLSENQRLEILAKAREFDDKLVERVVSEVQEQRQKLNALVEAAKREHQQQTRLELLKPIINIGSDTGGMYKYQTHKKPPMQQTLGRFGVVTKEAPVAPPSAPRFEPSSSLDSIRKSLQQSRTPGAKQPSVKTYTNPGVAPAAPRPAGFNSKPVAVIGRSLNSLKKKKVDSDSSDDDEDESQENGVDLSDLFVEKKKKVKVIEIDMNGRPITRPAKSASKELSDKRREEEYMRMRLNVNLKPLYSTILKWNYNSDSEYPTKDTEIYLPTKDSYEDAKDYIKTTEPLLMLECWQGIQSAKQTGQNVPFEIMIGSRTSCDGFFDVFASIKKSVLQDRKIGDSDLLVLGHLQGMNINSPQEALSYLKRKDTITCLAKVREIKSANSDFSDITIRVFPQGSMMGVITPKSIISCMKVMQMITIEREYSSLKGVQYYDLANEIFKAEPERPPDIPKHDVEDIQKTFNVNYSQASAILGTFDREGFSLIQGPPGTGKTKTILGLVGYYLGKKSHKEGVINIEDLRESSPQIGNVTGPKILVCAPSNAAVDELLIRLRNGVRDLKGNPITPKVVRMGRSDAANASVRDLTLEELVEKQLLARGATTGTSNDPQIREEHTKCIIERNKLRDEMQKENLEPEQILKIEEKMREVNKRKNELAKKLDEQREKVSIAYRTREIERRQAQAKILNEAQIICSTLSGSAHDFLSSLSIKFDQVIIDEACQCVELSAIIPLRYGCKKCIMVGDPNQLPPTVLSQKAASLNYEQSLFVRMQKRFPDAVYLLDVQYRMHPEISQFPSREFYNSRLKDGEGMFDKNTRPWHQIYPLTPYRFFDVTGKHQQSVQSKSLFNHAEAQIVLEMVEKVMNMLPSGQFNGRVGVISPYKEQIRVLKDIFRRKYGIAILNEIDFNTVDGYQGQEKDIIIMSCVRASPTGNVGFLSDVRRMNVALTRARASLWVLGNQESLMRNKVWNRLLTNAGERNVITKAYPGFLKQVTHQISASSFKAKEDELSPEVQKVSDTPYERNMSTDPIYFNENYAQTSKNSNAILPSRVGSIPKPKPKHKLQHDHNKSHNIPKKPHKSSIFGQANNFNEDNMVPVINSKAAKSKKFHVHVSSSKPSSTAKDLNPPSKSGYMPPRREEESANNSVPSVPSSTGVLPPKKRPLSSIFINNKRKRSPH